MLTGCALNKKYFAYVLAYRTLRVKNGCASGLLSFALKNKITLSAIGDGSFRISESGFKRLQSSAFPLAELDYSEPCGVLGFLIKAKICYGVILAMVISLFLVFFSGCTVFDIRISGNEEISDEELLSRLEECGLYVGGSWLHVERTEVESALLSASDAISWVNINRRGNVAYVEVIERKSGEVEKNYDFCNIVARVDCIIEDISVKRGYAVVKKGDVVKAGDILISGVPTDALGSFCTAEGVVTGRESRQVLAFVSEESEKKSLDSETKSGMAIKIFNFFINIFKYSGNLMPMCDIIERKTDLTLFGKKLPISFVDRYEVTYKTEKIRLTETELISRATDKMNFLIGEFSADGELLKLRSRGEFKNGGYEIKTDMVILSEVGECVPFEIR